MKTADCDNTVEILLAYSTQPNPADAVWDKAIKHVTTCVYCQHKVGHLVRALESEAEDALTCQACQDQLPEYLQAGTDGTSGPGWQSVKYHLATCPHCAVAYTELMEMLDTFYADDDPAPRQYPQPDLDFLSKETGEDRGWHIELGQLMIQFSSALIEAWTPRILNAQPVLRSDTSAKTHFQFSLENQGDYQAVHISAVRQPEDVTRCYVHVQVILLDKEWPDLADTEIILRIGEENRAQQFTDAFGETRFNNILIKDLPLLHFKIRPYSPA